MLILMSAATACTGEGAVATYTGLCFAPGETRASWLFGQTPSSIESALAVHLVATMRQKGPGPRPGPVLEHRIGVATIIPVGNSGSSGAAGFNAVSSASE